MILTGWLENLFVHVLSCLILPLFQIALCLYVSVTTHMPQWHSATTHCYTPDCVTIIINPHCYTPNTNKQLRRRNSPLQWLLLKHFLLHHPSIWRVPWWHRFFCMGLYWKLLKSTLTHTTAICQFFYACHYATVNIIITNVLNICTTLYSNVDLHKAILNVITDVKK